MTFGTWRWWICQPYAPATFTPRKSSCYSLSLGAESTPGPWYGRNGPSLIFPWNISGIQLNLSLKLFDIQSDFRTSHFSRNVTCSVTGCRQNFLLLSGVELLTLAIKSRARSLYHDQAFLFAVLEGVCNKTINWGAFAWPFLPRKISKFYIFRPYVPILPLFIRHAKRILHYTFSTLSHKWWGFRQYFSSSLTLKG
jgi:hypothetical protein